MDNSKRTILHIDMDAFYASVEQRDNPCLKGKPVIIGADPKGGRGRGVVSTCSYEARKFGIHSAMPISRAYRRCPGGVYLRPDMKKYAAESMVVREILYEYTPVMEFISLDEAFLDITGSLNLFGGAQKIASDMQEKILKQRELGSSVGVAPTKMAAKIASDLKKPMGIVIVSPDNVREFLAPLSIKRVWGIGKKTFAVFSRMGIETIGDLAALDEKSVEASLGSHGLDLLNLARGSDIRRVEPDSKVKSISNEITFEEDVSDLSIIRTKLLELSEKVFFRMWTQKLEGVTVTLKIRFEDFSTRTRSVTETNPPGTAVELYERVIQNLGRCSLTGRKIRLIGVGVQNFRTGSRQMNLFQDENKRKERQEQLNQTLADIKDRFGGKTIRYGRGM